MQEHREFNHTVHLILILHDQERIKVQVTEEPDIGPNQQVNGKSSGTITPEGAESRRPTPYASST